MLKSISIRYDAGEDRLLMELRTERDGVPASHWLHVTRRVAARWRQDLQAVLDLSAQAPAHLPTHTRAAVSVAHHQAMAQQASVRADPEGARPEAATAPQLVSRVVCARPAQPGRWILRFELRSGNHFTLTLRDTVLHGVVSALSTQVAAAGWALPELPQDRRDAQPSQHAGGLH